MAKRKRREKKPRVVEPTDIPEQDTNSNGSPEGSPEPRQEVAQISANPLPPPDVDVAEEADVLETDDTQPRKKRKTTKPSVPYSGSAEQEATPDDPSPKPAKSRYILFVGNLPYDTTNASIQSHFSALAPGFTVRHSTDKATGQSKGFAFLEFENDQVMRRCLKGYHHSIFYTNPPNRSKHSNKTPAETEDTFPIDSQDQSEDQPSNGIHPSRLQRMNTTTTHTSKRTPYPSSSDPTILPGGRRINIELTAGGGGGKSSARKEKLQAKNQKLSEERARVRETQRKLKEATDRNIAKGKTKPGSSGGGGRRGAHGVAGRGRRGLGGGGRGGSSRSRDSISSRKQKPTTYTPGTGTNTGALGSKRRFNEDGE